MFSRRRASGLGGVILLGLLLGCRPNQEVRNDEPGEPVVPSPPAQPSESKEGPARDSELLIFEEGVMSVWLPVNAKQTWEDGEGSKLRVEFEGTSVVLRPNLFDPYSSKGFQDKYGGQVLREERDAEHSALVARGAARGPAGDAVEVLGWAPGLLCYGSNVPAEAIDAAFEICSSMRRVGGIFARGATPKVGDDPVLSMASKSVETVQYRVQRVEAGELTCERLLDEVILYERDDAVQIEEQRGSYGPVRTWYAPNEGGGEAKRLEGFAVRETYCCSFSTYPWLGPVPDSDAADLMSLCDKAGQPGWPESFLPQPVREGGQVGARGRGAG